MNLSDTEIKKKLLKSFFNYLQTKYPVLNLSLKFENGGDIYDSIFYFKENQILITGVNLTKIEKLLWVLAHEYRHAQQFQKPIQINKLSKKKITLFISIMMTIFMLIQFYPAYSYLLMNIGIIPIIFIGHFLSDMGHENNSVFLELDADNFANKEIGGGAIDLTETVAIFRSMGDILLHILGFQTHPIFFFRYKNSLKYPFNADKLTFLQSETNALD